MATSAKLPAKGYHRIRFVDINILPEEYRRHRLPTTTLLTLLLVVVGIASLFGSEQLVRSIDPTLSGLEVQLRGLQDAKKQADAAVEQAKQLQGAIDKSKQSLQTMQQDYKAFSDQKILWSKVADTILISNSYEITYESITQGGSTVTLKGIANDYSNIIAYGDKLRQTGLFSRVHLESAIGQAPAAPEAPTSTPTPPATSTPVPIIIPTPVVPLPTSSPTPSPTQVPVPTPTATPTATPTPSPTPTSSPTPTPSVDYVVLLKKRTDVPGTTDLYNVIKGKVIDKEGKLIPGLKFRVQSCCPDWSTDYPRPIDPPSDGTFEFLVGKWKFDVSILNTRAEVAAGLDTNVPDFTGYHVWEITFQRVTSGAPAPQSNLLPAAPGFGSLVNARYLLGSSPNQATLPVARGNVAAPSLVATAQPSGQGQVSPQKAAVSFTMILEVKPGAAQ